MGETRHFHLTLEGHFIPILLSGGFTEDGDNDEHHLGRFFCFTHDVLDYF